MPGEQVATGARLDPGRRWGGGGESEKARCPGGQGGCKTNRPPPCVRGRPLGGSPRPSGRGGETPLAPEGFWAPGLAEPTRQKAGPRAPATGCPLDPTPRRAGMPRGRRVFTATAPTAGGAWESGPCAEQSRGSLGERPAERVCHTRILWVIRTKPVQAKTGRQGHRGSSEEEQSQWCARTHRSEGEHGPEEQASGEHSGHRARGEASRTRTRRDDGRRGGGRPA